MQISALKRIYRAIMKIMYEGKTNGKAVWFSAVYSATRAYSHCGVKVTQWVIS
jgi:hypothetical protein